MKNSISILLIALLMSCNSNSNSKTNSSTEDSVVKEPVEATKPPEPKQPKPEKKDSIFEGMYSYMADANMFVSCDKKMRMPVEMKGKYINLERQYLRTVDGGVEVFVKIKGYVKKVPAMEGDKKIDALVMQELLELSKDKKCR